MATENGSCAAMEIRPAQGAEVRGDRKGVYDVRPKTRSDAGAVSTSVISSAPDKPRSASRTLLDDNHSKEPISIVTNTLLMDKSAQAARKPELKETKASTNSRKEETSITTPDYIVKDKVYKAVLPLLNQKDESERRAIVELFILSHRLGQGFKDTNSFFVYCYQLEDGVPLDQLKIVDRHLNSKNSPAESSSNLASSLLGDTRPHLAVPPTNPVTIKPTVPSPSNAALVEKTTPKTRETEQKSAQQLKSELTCKVCLDTAVSVTFVPCGHLVACLSCSLALVECPVCRAFIRGTIKTFF